MPSDDQMWDMLPDPEKKKYGHFSSALPLHHIKSNCGTEYSCQGMDSS